MKRLVNIKVLECAVLVLFVLVTSGCVTQKSEKTFAADLARQQLDAALVRAVTDKNGKIYRNAVIRIEAPEYDFTYTGAAGTARADTGEAMTVDHQFTIASVGKTMTAV